MHYYQIQVRYFLYINYLDMSYINNTNFKAFNSYVIYLFDKAKTNSYKLKIISFW